MRKRDMRNRGTGISGKPALVTDTVVLTESDTAEDMQRHEGDIVFGLRLGLALSAIIWLAIIFAGFLIFN